MLGVILVVRILKREKCEGLFTKLNSGTTNSVGSTSKRSDDIFLCHVTFTIDNYIII